VVGLTTGSREELSAKKGVLREEMMMMMMMMMMMITITMSTDVSWYNMENKY
jgi:hypothetical protein